MAIAADDFDTPLGQPERIPGDFRRDKRGTPYVADPDGATVKSGARKGETKWLRYGRPSSFGKDVENTYNLQRWNERRIVFGLTVDNEDLTERIVALADLDPESDEGKDAADAVIVEAKRLAEAHIAAARGTHMHAVTEDDDSDRDWVSRAEHGADLGIPDHTQAAMVAAWRKMVAECGFDITHIEHAVVHDAWRQAGTLDRVARLTKPLAFKDGTVLPAGLVIVLDVKGLALDTPIPTPTGWTTMGAIQAGDQVIGSDGQPCNVVFKSELRERPCYRLMFDDGTSVVADDEHRWAVDTALIGRQVLTTRELAESLFRHGQRQHRVLNAEPIALPERDLPIDPYILGVWLGDGKHTSGEITKPDDNGVWGEMAARGAKYGKAYFDKRTGCRTSTVLGLRTALRERGLLGDKHVPDEYLRASLGQRLELLRGLMDADGTWNKARHRALFCNTNKRLSAAVYEIVVSLGERAHAHEVERSGFGVTVTSHDVEWSPFRHNPFAEPGKAGRAQVRDSKMNDRRLVVSVDEVPSVPTQCIAVDSPDHTYLCTESMVVTHNTGKMRTQASGRIEYWNSYAVQLAAYAGAVPYDTDTDQRGEWDVDIDQRYAVIAHLPVDEALQGTAVCRLVLVDLEAARKAVEDIVLPAKAWQASDPFAHGIELEFSVPVVEPEAKPDRGVRHDFSKPAQPTPVPFERPTVDNEGDVVSDQQDAEIVRRVRELDQQAKAVLDVLARTAKEAGHPFSRGAGLTLRRWHIYRALLRLGAHFAAELEDHHIRATLALVLPDTAQPGVALGPAIGSLTLEEARRFVQAAIQVMAADAALTFDDAGHPKWLGVGNTAA